MSGVKKAAQILRLVIPAGGAKPAPPVGPALGQAGVKIMDFCKDFNNRTADIKVRLDDMGPVGFCRGRLEERGPVRGAQGPQSEQG